MSRCGTCKYYACMGNIECIQEECPLYDPDNEFSSCKCVDCMFDRNEDCTMYTPRAEVEEEDEL